MMGTKERVFSPLPCDVSLEGVMNCGSYAVASRHGESKTVPK
jgi:hypothetical protein